LVEDGENSLNTPVIKFIYEWVNTNMIPQELLKVTNFCVQSFQLSASTHPNNVTTYVMCIIALSIKWTIAVRYKNSTRKKIKWIFDCQRHKPRSHPHIEIWSTWQRKKPCTSLYMVSIRCWNDHITAIPIL
jgi:hypothetical protein